MISCWIPKYTVLRVQNSKVLQMAKLAIFIKIQPTLESSDSRGSIKWLWKCGSLWGHENRKMTKNLLQSFHELPRRSKACQKKGPFLWFIYEQAYKRCNASQNWKCFKNLLLLTHLANQFTIGIQGSMPIDIAHCLETTIFPWKMAETARTI